MTALSLVTTILESLGAVADDTGVWPTLGPGATIWSSAEVHRVGSTSSAIDLL